MKSIKTYIIDAVIGILIAVLAFLYKDIQHAKTKIELIGILSDGFFLSGVLLTGFGALTILSGHGAFDVIRYGMNVFHSSLFSRTIFRRDQDSKKLNVSYFDYMMERRSKSRSLWHLVITGMFFLVLAGIFTLMVL